VRIFVLARHGESVLNSEDRVNGDPSISVELTDSGLEQARTLGVQVAQLPLDLCVHTSFDRTRKTAEAALDGRNVPLVEEPLLNDIDVGTLEGVLISEYRAWKRLHTRRDAFPEGESLDDAARRYAAALRSLLARDLKTALVVCHEIPVRYAVNAAAGSDSLDGPAHNIENASPYVFDERGLERAAARIEELTSASAAGRVAPTGRTG
jgi:broad specificity phosphatase PhoE